MIVLVRHTRVAVPPGTIYGHSDVALAESFETEADAVLSQLITMVKTAAVAEFDGPIHIHSSPSSRCSRLAYHVLAGLARFTENLCQPRINFDARLREMHFGDWENQTWSAITDAGGKTWGENWATQATPNGESFPQLYARASSFLTSLQSTTETGARQSMDIVITHSGVIRCLHAHMNGLTNQQVFSLNPDFGSVRLL